VLNNLGVKLVCLLVALVLWVHVASHRQVDEVLQLPVRMVGLPDSLAFHQRDFPRRVGVRVRGSRLQLLVEDLALRERGYVRVDLAGTRAGAYRHVISALDAQVTGQPLEIVPPVSLRVELYRRLCRTLPVRVAVEGQPPPSNGLPGAPEIVPAEVQVCGPEPIVLALDHVDTVPLEVVRRRRPVRRLCALLKPDPDVLLLPVEVEVTLAADPALGATSTPVPLELARGPGEPGRSDAPRQRP
jgi:YbbR domain-containing protein